MMMMLYFLKDEMFGRKFEDFCHLTLSIIGMQPYPFPTPKTFSEIEQSSLAQRPPLEIKVLMTNSNCSHAAAEIIGIEAHTRTHTHTPTHIRYILTKWFWDGFYLA